jgi:predicted acyl esterase
MRCGTLKTSSSPAFPPWQDLLVVFAVGVPLHAQTDASYSIIETMNVMVAMRDGVKLAADIYRPTQNGQPIDNKFSVILVRTPYNKEGAASVQK